jgi:hypothetical protein
MVANGRHANGFSTWQACKISDFYNLSRAPLGHNVDPRFKVNHIRNNKNKKNKPKGKENPSNSKLQKEVSELKRELKSVKGSNRKSKGGPKSRMSESEMAISECSQKYAEALVDPFSGKARGCCIPTTSAGQSYKVSSRTTFTMVVGGAAGTTGTAMLAVAPSPWNDKNIAVYSSSALYVLNQITTDTSTPGTSAATLPNLPFSSAAGVGTGATVSARIVVIGIKVRYAGSKLYLGGAQYVLTPPDRKNTNGSTVTGLTSNSTCAIMDVKAKAFTEVTTPINETERVFSDENVATPQLQLYPLSNGNGTASVPPPAINVLITSTAGNQFIVEMIQHVEYIGGAASFAATPSDNDVVGFSRVYNSFSNMVMARLSDPWRDRKLIYNAISTGVRMAPMVLNLVTGGTGAAASSAKMLLTNG